MANVVGDLGLSLSPNFLLFANVSLRMISVFVTISQASGPTSSSSFDFGAAILVVFFSVCSNQTITKDWCGMCACSLFLK